MYALAICSNSIYSIKKVLSSHRFEKFPATVAIDSYVYVHTASYVVSSNK